MGVKISLKAARVNADYTQVEIAALLHKNKQTIVNWENGKTPIDRGNLEYLCKVYKIPRENIFLPKELS